MSHSQLLLLRDSIKKMHVPEMAMNKNALAEIQRNKSSDEWFVKQTQLNLNQVDHHVTLLRADLDRYVEDIDKAILDQTFDFIREDNIHWDLPNIKYRTADYNRNYRQLPISEDTLSVVRGRIGTYTDWRFPGLEIGTGDATWTRMLVASDPLYIVDYNNEFLESTKATFNEVYKRRLRCYLSNGTSCSIIFPLIKLINTCARFTKFYVLAELVCLAITTASGRFVHCAAKKS